MAEHKLPYGKRLISALSDLGELLDYHVEPEFPVDTVDHGDPPAVDLAWFAEKGQKVPLMIFEIESAAGNTIPNNPLKVFGQLTTKLEKPLFYFQILATGGGETHRVGYLETQYGTHNYRIYRIGEDEGTQLVNDILGQHRRISNYVDYVELFELLNEAAWDDVVDTLAVLRNAYAIGLSPSARLPSYIHLARSHPEVLEDLRAAITEQAEVIDWRDAGQFRSYIGRQWSPFLLCSYMIGISNSLAERERWDRALSHWQNNATDMPMLDAALGLDRDYTEFLLGASGPLVTLCAATAGAPTPAVRELASVLRDILNRLKPEWHGLQVAVWLAHYATWAGDNELFEVAQAFINSTGGLSRTLLFKPPSTISVNDGEREDQFPSGDEIPCPNLTAFREAARDYYAGYLKPEVGEVALRALDDDSYLYEWAGDILASLWATRQATR